MRRRSARVTITGILLAAALLASSAGSHESIVASDDGGPIEVVSVLGPVSPVGPGGAAVKLTLRNAGIEPVISPTATLEVFSGFGTPFDFSFDKVTPSSPLRPGKSASSTLVLIGGGFDSNESYPLVINATLQNGSNSVYTELVQIVRPPPIPVWAWAIMATAIIALATTVILIRRQRRAKA
jgi:hypothetical protein